MGASHAVVLFFPVLVVGLWFLLVRSTSGGGPGISSPIVRICVGLLITWGVILVATALLTN